MNGKWFANRGQVIQTTGAMISACVAIVALYFVLKSNNSLPRASAMLFSSGAICLFLVGILIGRRLKQNRPQEGVTSQAERAVSLVTSAKFDAESFFRLSYRSPLTDESETNIRKAAADNQPNDREGFYARLIGIGLIAYTYDVIWYVIFRSQLLAILELNRKGGLLPLAGVKAFYDQAAMSNPAFYANYSFEDWLGYMKSWLLLIVHPSNMVEITLRGKDFLKYLVHFGREPDQRGL